MKVVFLGGPHDGKEIDVASDTREWTASVVNKSKPITLRELTSPYADLSMSVEKWPIRKLVAPSGRTLIAIVHPSLDAWIDKNFGEKGKKDGTR